MTDPLTVLVGEAHDITREDGTRETVTLRQLKVREYPAARLVVGDEPRLLELMCDRPAGWAESLSPQSYEELTARVPEVNALFFACSARQARTQMALLPPEIRTALTNSGLPS